MHINLDSLRRGEANQERLKTTATTERPMLRAWHYLEPWLNWSDYQHLGPDAVVRATNASTARHLAYLILRESHGDISMVKIKLRRAQEYDLYAPEPHPIIGQLSDAQRDIVAHAAGNASTNPGYRNHYVCAADDPDLTRLVELGLFVGPMHSSIFEPGQGLFRLTAHGSAVARSMLPRERWRLIMEAGS